MNSYAGSTGGCQCGAVRYRLKADPLALYVCHCLHCQKQSSSAFGMSMWVHRAAMEVTKGTLSFWSTRGDSGAKKVCAFCGNCGSRIYHAAGGDPEILSVKAGSLDDSSVLRPTCHLWTKRAQSWLKVNLEKDICYESEPPNDATLLRQWSSARTVTSKRRDT